MPDDPRVVDSTGALELKGIPKRMLVVGGGIIGLEMATVYSTLGTRIDVVEMLDIMMAGADRDLVKVWEKMNAPRFDNVMLKTKTVAAEATQGGDQGRLRRREGPGRAAGLRPGAGGGRPQRERQEDQRGQGGRGGDRPRLHPRSTSRCAPTSRTSSRSATSSAQPMLAHKAVHEAHVAAEVAPGRSRTSMRGRFRRWPTPTRKSRGRDSPRSSARREGIKYGKAVFPWAASGRAIANGRDEGFTKLSSTRRRTAASAAASSARTRAT